MRIIVHNWTCVYHTQTRVRMKRGTYGMETSAFYPRSQRCFSEEKRSKNRTVWKNRHIRTGEFTLGEEGGMRVENFFLLSTL